MRRLASGKTRDIFSKFVTNPDLMCRNVVVDPTTDLNNTECSVRADGLYHESDLVAMGVKLNNRTLTVVFFSTNIEIAHMIFCDLAKSFCIGSDHCHYFIFKAGCTICVRDCCNHFQRRFFVHCNTSLRKEHNKRDADDDRNQHK